jgi:hypothetical protein
MKMVEEIQNGYRVTLEKFTVIDYVDDSPWESAEWMKSSIW